MWPRCPPAQSAMAMAASAIVSEQMVVVVGGLAIKEEQAVEVRGKACDEAPEAGRPDGAMPGAISGATGQRVHYPLLSFLFCVFASRRAEEKGKSLSGGPLGGPRGRAGAKSLTGRGWDILRTCLFDLLRTGRRGSWRLRTRTT